MASRFREILKDHPKLKGKEIFLVEEHKKEIGTYVIVFIQPFKVKECRCRNHEFMCNEFIYHFGYGFQISDRIKCNGLGCHHFNYQPDQEELNRTLHRYLKSRNIEYFDYCEAELEKKFEQAFGAA